MNHGSTGGRRRLSVESHRDNVVSLVGPDWPRAEAVPLSQSLGRVLAADAAAGVDVPRFRNSAMDGFAIRWADAARPLSIALDLPAGVAAARALGEGEAARIMTGAPLPEGADIVVPIEDCVVEGESVRFVSTPRLGQHVRQAGEDVRHGKVVLTAGTRLAARHLAAAAAVGAGDGDGFAAARPDPQPDAGLGNGAPLGGGLWRGLAKAAAPPTAAGQLLVAVKPKVAVVATGDELAAPGDRLGPASIYDSNGPYLTAAVAAAGGVVTLQARCPDDPAALRRLLDQAAEAADVILVSGGASVGDHDVTRDVTGGEVEFVTVAMQPGKPQGWGRWRGRPLLALPGNPVSVAVSFACFGRALLDAMLGAAPDPARRSRVEAGWESPAGRRQFMPVAVRVDATGATLARPATPGGSGSHLVTALARADALAVVGEEVRRVEVGDVLTLVRLD